MQSSRSTEGGAPLEEPSGATPGGGPADGGEAAAGRSGDGVAGGGAHTALADELARIEDRYKRALADLDNYRKRADQEVDRRVAEAREDVMRDWLQVLDSVERALVMDPQGACADGLRAVLQQIDAVLDREGALRIGRPGDEFDPERHEAIGVVSAGDVPDRTVVEVQRSGVTRGKRLLRPAQVVVARAPEHAH
jgi:molecular chaperone GrpE